MKLRLTSKRQCQKCRRLLQKSLEARQCTAKNVLEADDAKCLVVDMGSGKTYKAARAFLKRTLGGEQFTLSVEAKEDTKDRKKAARWTPAYRLRKKTPGPSGCLCFVLLLLLLLLLLLFFPWWLLLWWGNVMLEGSFSDV